MPERFPRVRGSAASAIGILALAFSLAGCGWLFGTPVLRVTPDVLSLEQRPAAGASQLTISNAGTSQSQLSFSIRSNDSRVTARPGSGVLTGGGSVDVEVVIDDASLEVGERIDGTLTVTSNGGSATVPFAYLKTVGGLGSCGTFPLAAGASRSPAEPMPPRAFSVAPRVIGPVPGEVLVGYARPIGLQDTAAEERFRSRMAEGVRSSYGLRSIAPVASGAELVYTADPDGTIARLRADPRVRYAERNAYVELQLVPNDPLFVREQWNMSRFGLQEAWDIETGDSGSVIIAIIDSGVQLHHPDLVAKMLPGCDFNGRDNDPNPGSVVTGDTAHGTHVAGIAAAVGNNREGVAGVAFGARVRILPVKIFDDTGTHATVEQLAQAIRWSVGLHVAGVADNPNPADIVNLSLGVPGRFQTLDDATSAAWAAGALVVAAAGNHTGGQASSVMSPANGPDVLAVGSVDDDKNLSYFSNTGAEIDVVAPGGLGPSYCGYVVSTIPFDDYGCEAGTSMAAPFVSGQAALLKSQVPSRSNRDLSDLILSTTEPGNGTAEQFGRGIACVDRALGALTRCGLAIAP